MSQTLTNIRDVELDDMESNLNELVARLRGQERRLGRPVRVLLIGNIANNAFHLAKLLRRIGLDCDVICPHYYHIMGCPEWEDADFEGEFGNDFSPQWSKVKFENYDRPRWFAQGPTRLCIDYLEARILKKAKESDCLWNSLRGYNGYGAPVVSNGLLHPGALLGHARAFFIRLLDFVFSPHRIVTKIGKAAAWLTKQRFPLSAFGFVLGLLGNLMFGLSKLMLLMHQRDAKIRSQAAAIVARFHSTFPARSDKLDLSDVLPFSRQVTDWRKLFKYYDIVQGFSTDPIYPMLAGRRYFAFEHGTLREIPDRPNALGRLTSLAYNRAQHVFVTNADCMDTARRLAGDRAEYINHPYDEDDAVSVARWIELRNKLRDQLDAEFLVFHPTRHDWVPQTGYADKANDVIIRGLARMRNNGISVGAVFCAWGCNVAESQALVQSLGLKRYVHWEKTMAMRRFFRTARACDIVVDQFKLGAIGGVAFKALAAGVPVCTRIDVAKAEQAFGAVPPVVNCSTEDEILNSLSRLAANPEALRRLGADSRAWFCRYHGRNQVLIAHLRAYLKELEQVDAGHERDHAAD